MGIEYAGRSCCRIAPNDFECAIDLSYGSRHASDGVGTTRSSGVSTTRYCRPEWESTSEADRANAEKLMDRSVSDIRNAAGKEPLAQYPRTKVFRDLAAFDLALSNLKQQSSEAPPCIRLRSSAGL